MTKKILTMFFIAVTVIIFASVPAMAAETEAKMEITAEWNEEMQTIEVSGIDYQTGIYKVQLIDANNKTYTCAADKNTHLPINKDGKYTVRVLKNKTGKKYYVIFKKAFTIENCKEYLGSSEVVDFEENQKFLSSKAIQKILNKKTPSGIAKSGFQYLTKNWEYNYDRAKNVKSWYVPNTDANNKDKKGICLDYAAAYASIMREAGIPCKVIFGNVQTKKGTIYHAWNEVLINDEWKFVDTCWNEFGSTNYIRTIVHVY